jgi:predicted permease
VASFVLATQLKGDPALASASIVVSTLAAGPALAVVLALTD